jgi:hypothetical protein
VWERPEQHEHLSLAETCETIGLPGPQTSGLVKLSVVVLPPTRSVGHAIDGNSSAGIICSALLDFVLTASWGS